MNSYLRCAVITISLGLAVPAFAQLDLGNDIKNASGLLEPTKIKGGVGKGDVPTEKRVKGPTEITASEASFDQKASIGVFTTDVIVKDPEFDLTCQKLTVFLKKPAEKGAKPAGDKTPAPIGAKPEPETGKTEKKQDSGLEKSVAEGNVVIIQEKPAADGKISKYVAKGDRAVYETATGNLTLYGNPEITQSLGGSMAKRIKSIEEGCIMILNRDGRIDTKNGRATTTILDGSALESPKAK